jgi:hypothetical protein
VLTGNGYRDGDIPPKVEVSWIAVTSRVSWWAAIFAFFFGCVSILRVFLSIYQAVLIQL